MKFNFCFLINFFGLQVLAQLLLVVKASKDYFSITNWVLFLTVIVLVVIFSSITESHIIYLCDFRPGLAGQYVAVWKNAVSSKPLVHSRKVDTCKRVSILKIIFRIMSRDILVLVSLRVRMSRPLKCKFDIISETVRGCEWRKFRNVPKSQNFRIVSNLDFPKISLISETVKDKVKQTKIWYHTFCQWSQLTIFFFG